MLSIFLWCKQLLTSGKYKEVLLLLYYILRRLIPLSEGAPSRFHLYILMHTPYCHILSSTTLFCSEKSHLCVYVCMYYRVNFYFPLNPWIVLLGTTFWNTAENRLGWCCCHCIPVTAITKKWVWIFVPVSPSGSDIIPGFFLSLYSLLQMMGLD